MYLVGLSVCYHVFCHHVKQTGKKVTPTGSAHYTDFIFKMVESYGVKTKSMKSTKVQNLNELRMHGTASLWAGISSTYAFTHGLLLVQLAESLTWASYSSR